MARAKRWTIPFKSLNGTDCRIDIYDEGYTGTAVELSPNNANAPGYAAAEPIFYEEDNSDNLLNVIRYKTGYINLIETSYGSLADLYPETDTEHYIEFYYGSRLDFTGYMMTQAFDNDWVAPPREIQFPIQSPLGLLGQMKFAARWPVTQLYMNQCMTEIMTALNAGYTDYYVPTGIQTDMIVSSRVLAPFANEPTDPDGSDMYDPMTYEDYLEGVCNMYGLILHDVPGKMLFSKFEYTGTYSHTGSDPFDSDQAPALGNTFSIASADNRDSLVRPLGKIEVRYDGDKNFEQSIDFGHMPYVGMSIINLWEGTPTWFGAAVAWLKMMAPEFYSPSMLSSNDLNSALKPTQKGVIGASIGTKQAVVVYCSSNNFNTDAKTVLEWRISQYPGVVVSGYLKITMNVTKHTMIQDEGEEVYPFKLSVEVDGEYYNDTDLDFDNTVHKYFPGSNGIFWVKCNIPTRGNQMKITLWGSSACTDGNLYTIDNLSVEVQAEKLYQYKEQYKTERIIKLEEHSPDEGQVAMTLSRDKVNSNSVVYACTAGYTAPTYPYLAKAQNRLEIDVKGTLPDLKNLYFYKWQYWIQGWRWRIIAISFNPRDDIYRLTMHRSSTIE